MEANLFTSCSNEKEIFNLVLEDMGFVGLLKESMSISNVVLF